MKYIKYILIGIFVIFVIKGLDNVVSGSQVPPTNVELKEQVVNQAKVKSLAIDVKNANINLNYADIDQINVVSKLTQQQHHDFHYNVTSNATNGQLAINQYNENNRYDQLTSYGNIDIYVPKSFKFSGITIKMDNGTINVNVESENLNVKANSLKTQLLGRIDKINIDQQVGQINLKQLNAVAIDIIANQSNVDCTSLTSDNMKVKNAQQINAQFDNVSIKELSLDGQYKDAKFVNMVNQNYSIEAKSIKHSSLEYSDNKYVHATEHKAKMMICAPNVTISLFQIK